MILLSEPVFGQGGSSASNVYVIGLLVIVGALVLVSAILTLSENLIQIEAQKSGINTEETPVSLFSSFSNVFKDPAPNYTAGHKLIDLKRGYDINLNGSPSSEIREGSANRFAVRPGYFRGLAPIPKVTVKEGDEVKAGDVIFHDKKNDLIKYVAPVSGEVVEIRRGDKRAISEVVILADKKIKFKQFNPPSVKEASREDIVSFLLESGGWTLFNERPFDVLPDPEVIPTNIFISTFDTAPLAPDNNLVIDGNEKAFQVGIDTLARLTTGSVHLGVSASGKNAPHSAFSDAENAQKHWFRGVHPSGNVGVQMHHIAPIRSGQKVWTLTVQEVISLGELMYKGNLNMSRIVAIAGAQTRSPHYAKTYVGANVGELLKDNLSENKVRLIDGDILSGRQIGKDDFLNYRTDQITAIEEGDYYEMFGWLLPLSPRPSISGTFPNKLFGALKFDGDTNTHGEKRAFVMTGQYEKVLPMNIYPQHLFKAIMIGDFEQIEGLGIAELSEEDVALCEFVCTSKMPLQSILRDGLDMIREQS